jgi:hypothetical protein
MEQLSTEQRKIHRMQAKERKRREKAKAGRPLVFCAFDWLRWIVRCLRCLTALRLGSKA